MAYATVDQLAAAMRLTVSIKNQDTLQQCLDSAAEEIDHCCGRSPDDPLPTDPPDPLAVRVNIDRAVEHWKATDATFGGVGFADTGILRAKLDGFERHAIALTPLVQTFGVG